MTKPEKLKDFPKFLYRYRSSATQYFEDEIARAIFHQEVFLAGASSLNDPFDFRPIHEPSELGEILRELRRAHGTKPIFDKQRYEELKGRPVSRDEYRREARGLRPSMQVAKLEQTVTKRLLANSPARSRVACFSEDGNNIPMWAHYAGDHTGVCIKYKFLPDLLDFSRLVPLSVTYQSKRPTMNTLQIRAFTQRGSSELMIDQSKQDAFEALYLTKSDHWAYEKEWRVFDTGDVPPSYEAVMCLKPVEIAFGIRSGDGEAERFAEQFGDKIQVSKCTTSATDFSIQRDQVK